MTTSISSSMGISCADGRFSLNNQEHKFRLEAQTYTESNVLNSLVLSHVEGFLRGTAGRWDMEHDELLTRKDDQCMA
jgi:hypothetical protein